MKTEKEEKTASSIKRKRGKSDGAKDSNSLAIRQIWWFRQKLLLFVRRYAQTGAVAAAIQAKSKRVNLFEAVCRRRRTAILEDNRFPESKVVQPSSAAGSSIIQLGADWWCRCLNSVTYLDFFRLRDTVSDARVGANDKLKEGDDLATARKRGEQNKKQIKDRAVWFRRRKRETAVVQLTEESVKA